MFKQNHLGQMKRIIIFIAVIGLVVILPGFYHSGGENGDTRSSAPGDGPQPEGWYSGDMHVHRNCGGDSITPVKDLIKEMEVNDLMFLTVLADMGNGEVKDSEIDLARVTGGDAPESTSERVVRFDAEWHWDPEWVTFENKALGGHIIFLGLKEARQIWEESLYKVLEWGRKQNAVSGFAHMQHLDGTVQDNLTCCIPIDYPVEAAMGTIDFISEDIRGSESVLSAYYRLLNCGFRLGLAAGTDYPCNHILLPYKEPLGTLLTYVKIEGSPDYKKWAEGIKYGRTVISRNRNNEFLDLTVNGNCGPGDDIRAKEKADVSVVVKWTAKKQLFGRIELIRNGEVVAVQPGTSLPGEPLVLEVEQEFEKSGWLCARRMDENGHQSHTGAVYVTVDYMPVRASAGDAEYFVSWIDNLLENISPGGRWHKYYKNDYQEVRHRYIEARKIYRQISEEAGDWNK